MQHATAAAFSAATAGSVVSTKLHTSPLATPISTTSLTMRHTTSPPTTCIMYMYIVYPCSTVAVRPLTVITVAAVCPSV